MADTLNDMITGANTNNLFMQCDEFNHNAFSPLPESFSARNCRYDELNAWKTMWAQGEYMEFVDYFYDRVYAPQGDEFFLRCLFAVDEDDKPVTSSSIWRTYGRINYALGIFRAAGM